MREELIERFNIFMKRKEKARKAFMADMLEEYKYALEQSFDRMGQERSMQIAHHPGLYRKHCDAVDKEFDSNGKIYAWMCEQVDNYITYEIDQFNDGKIDKETYLEIMEEWANCEVPKGKI